jgi:hypothetical protein
MPCADWANEGQQHFHQNFLDLYASEQISMRNMPEYQGPTMGEGKLTTLGDIDKRISDINDLVRAATRTAKTGGAEMSAMEKLGLESEVGKLRQTLSTELSKRTGVAPEDIQALRQRYGQQFELADTIDAARRSRLGQIGAVQEGGSGIALNKTGVVDKILTRARGGQQYLADANFRSAIEPFKPQPSVYPNPATQQALSGPIARTPLWQGIEAQRPEVQMPTPDTAGAAEIAQNIQARSARNGMARASAQSSGADARAAALRRGLNGQ